MILAIKELCHQSQTLKNNIQNLQQQQQPKLDNEYHKGIEAKDPQPLSTKIWDAHVLDNFKSPSLENFDGKSGLQEHDTIINI